MLNVMRENLRHLKLVLWITAISLTLYLGVGYCDQGGAQFSEEWAARVGDESISTREFQSEARDLADYYRSVLGERYEQQRASLAIGQAAVQRLVNRRIILAEARRLGLDASPEEIVDAIRNHPGLQDGNGNFVGQQRYQELMRGRRGGAAGFERLLADDLIVRKWQRVIAAPVRVTEQEVRELYRDRYEKTDLRYVMVASADQQISTDVSEQELQQWYEDHRDDYLKGETRRVRYVLIDRQSQLEKVEVDDAELRALYDQRRAEFEQPLRRRSRHILIASAPSDPPADKAAARQRAEQLMEQIRAGADFAELAARNSDDPGSKDRGGDLGYAAQGAMVGPFDQALFSTPIGQLADLVETQFGFHILEVLDERPAGVPPFEEVRERLAFQARQQQADALLQSESARLAEEIRSAAALDDVAAREGLTVEELELTERDRLPELGPSPGLVPAIFALEPGEVTGPLQVRRGLMIAALSDVVPATVAPLEEVRGRVNADILNDRVRRAARERARQALDSSADLDAAAKALGLEIQLATDVAPGEVLPTTGGTTPELREALFGEEAEAGDRGAIDVPAGTLIYEISAREGFDAGRFADARPQLEDELGRRRQEDLIQAMMLKLRSDYEVVINAEIVSRVDG